MTLVIEPPPSRRSTWDDEQRCRVCGCTDDFACDPPCWWIEDDLCSAHEGLADD